MSIFTRVLRAKVYSPEENADMQRRIREALASATTDPDLG
jgi:hypothetical protein